MAATLVLLVAGLGAGLTLTNTFGLKSSISAGVSDFTKGVGFMQARDSQVQVVQVRIIADTFDGSQALPATCGQTSLNSYIELTNVGASSDSVSSVTITYGGTDNVFPAEGACTLGPSGSGSSTMYLLFPGPSELPNSTTPLPSEPFLGTVNLAAGVKLQFSGDFQQGYPTVFVASGTVYASQLESGSPNATCAASPPGDASYLELSNNGTEGASVSQVTLSWNGTSTTYPVAAACALGPEGAQSASVFIVLSGGSAGTKPTAGERYSATVSLRNGAQTDITALFDGLML